MPRLKRHGLALASCLVLTACGCGSTPANEEADARMALYVSPCESPAPLLLSPGEKVPDSYIIVFDKALKDPFARIDLLEWKYGFASKSRYKTALKGFSATLNPETVGALRCEPDVNYIEEESLVQPY
ncbi:protease inhibitor I9 family protein [Archangium violaceum]|uniref:protease inhibitor I9 family protein n=1 Tax=Archangium violaceum TaxID=83451 RepID=UPI002B2E36A4|nr:protease inhibitor I9 family protein [Archangium gephyra]